MDKKNLAERQVSERQFSDRLASARQNLARDEGRSAAPAAHSLATGWRLVLELLATMAVGGFLGWWLDVWLGTAPILLLVMIFLGSAAGIWSIYRQSRAMSAPPDDSKGNQHGRQ